VKVSASWIYNEELVISNPRSRAHLVSLRSSIGLWHMRQLCPRYLRRPALKSFSCLAGLCAAWSQLLLHTDSICLARLYASELHMYRALMHDLAASLASAAFHFAGGAMCSVSVLLWILCWNSHCHAQASDVSAKSR